MSNSSELMSYVPFVGVAEKQLSRLEADLGRAILNGKVYDARVGLALDLFDSMSHTKDEMVGLNQNLISTLTDESFKRLISEAKFKAQVIADIIKRNLFERTADIGFLATDDDIRCFMCGDDGFRAGEKSVIVKRLREYQAKYSVYNNIYVFDVDGNLIVSANDDKLGNISDAFIDQAKMVYENSGDKFSEYYGNTSLGSGDKLLYSFKITETNNPKSKTLGVLTLSFDFEDEMNRIFQKLNYGISGTYLMLLDDEGKVMASNCDDNFPKGTVVKKALDGFQIVDVDGKYYLSITAQSNGYQGFHGLPWFGHIMVPLEEGFELDLTTGELHSSNIIALDILRSRLVSNGLRILISDVSKINDNLKNLIYNGEIIVSNAGDKKQEAKGLKPVFDRVKGLADECRGLFSTSIGGLVNMVKKSLLDDIKAIASLGIDVMDRNLYERANDCRWWALTTKFRILLDKNPKTKDHLKMMADILVYIHELYTVYDCLFIYDDKGKVIALSKYVDGKYIGIYEESQLLKFGNVYGEGYVKEVLTRKNTNSQFYTVSDFSKSPFYDDKFSYTYSAPIKSESGATIGGIGVVFDSLPQFNQMLLDILPTNTDGTLMDGAFGLFVSKDGSVISTTDDNISIGSKFDVGQKFTNLKNGESISDTVELNGEKYIVGASCSSGYREFKTSDGYKDDVLCLVFVKL